MFARGAGTQRACRVSCVSVTTRSEQQRMFAKCQGIRLTESCGTLVGVSEGYPASLADARIGSHTYNVGLALSLARYTLCG